MEDVECLPERSNLKTYLQDLGFWDIEVKKSVPSSNTIQFDLPSSKAKRYNAEFIDEEVIKQIKILISTQMLFEEDIRNIENLLSNFKITKYGMLRHMFQGIFGVFIIFFGLLLYWVLGSYAFFIGSSFYAYKAADYLWKKNYNETRLKKLASVLQSNFALLNKTAKFIAENNKCMQSNNFTENDVLGEFKTGFDFYNNFKTDFYRSLNEVIEILSVSTKKLISKLPLYDYVENPQYYICNNFNKNCYESIELSKLYQIYLLVQSEFLQRFILSLIPNLNISKNNTFQELNKILTESSVNLLKVKNNLNKKFKYVFFNGIYCTKSRTNLSIPIKHKAYSSNYEEEFASSIHDVSNSFQNLLLKSRVLEENFKSKNAFEDLENDLINMQTELNLCQRNISDGLILLKKASGAEKKSQVLKVEEKLIENSSNEVEKVLVGYTDLNPTVEDEIFEAYFGEDCVDRDFSAINDWDVDDIKKRLEKEYSRNVIKELKTKLIDKAKNWEKREAEILFKKYRSDKNETSEPNNFSKETKDLFNKNEVECTRANDKTSMDSSHFKELLNEKKKESSFAPSQYKCQSPATDFENSEQLKPCDGIVSIEKKLNERNLISNTLADEEFHQNCFQLVNKNFLNDLNCARKKIFKTNATEELYYCNSDENLEEENFE